MNGNEVRSQINELERVRAQTRLWRTLASLALLVIVLGGIGTIITSARNLFQPGPVQEEFAATLSTNLQRDTVPAIETIATQALTEVRPQVETEFRKLNKRAPELAQASMQELETLQKNLPARGEKILTATLGEMMVKKQDKLKQMFPSVTDAKISQGVASVSEEAQSRLVNAHDSLLSQHMAALNGIVSNLNHIQNTEVVSAQSKQADWEMGVTLLDLLHKEVHDLRPVSLTKTPASKPGKPSMNKPSMNKSMSTHAQPKKGASHGQ